MAGTTPSLHTLCEPSWLSDGVLCQRPVSDGNRTRSSAPSPSPGPQGLHSAAIAARPYLCHPGPKRVTPRQYGRRRVAMGTPAVSACATPWPISAGDGSSGASGVRGKFFRGDGGENLKSCEPGDAGAVSALRAIGATATGAPKCHG
jgi:hypothetical protein